MYAVTLDSELTAFATLSVVTPADLARLSFHPRRELLEAARTSNATSPVAFIVANQTAVVATAQSRAKSSIR